MSTLKYNEITLNNMEEAYRRDKQIQVQLSKKEGLVCLALLDKINNTQKFQRKDHSLLSRVKFLLSGLLLNIRVLFFYSSYFEIMIFQNKKNLYYSSKEFEKEGLIITFKRKSMGSE